MSSPQSQGYLSNTHAGLHESFDVFFNTAVSSEHAEEQMQAFQSSGLASMFDSAVGVASNNAGLEFGTGTKRKRGQLSEDVSDDERQLKLEDDSGSNTTPATRVLDLAQLNGGASTSGHGGNLPSLSPSALLRNSAAAPPLPPWEPSSAQMPEWQQLPPLHSSLPQFSGLNGHHSQRTDESDLLQTLARVAVPDSASAMSAGPKSEDDLVNELMPDESLRDQLLDLYFNHVVNPTFPMLDKGQFFRWSHQLAGSSKSTRVPAELWLAVFAIALPYLPHGGHALDRRRLADASRTAVLRSIEHATIETVQSAAILALFHWGEGELERAWTLSALSVVLAFNLGMGSASNEKDAIRLNTFHSVLVIQNMLSFRISRQSLVVPDTIPALPEPHSDGTDDFEMWRPDKSVAILREEHGIPSDNVARGAVPAVRSFASSTFAKTCALSTIAASVARALSAQRRGSAEGPIDRSRLVGNLAAWGGELSAHLKLGESPLMTEKMSERSRFVTDMHLLALPLYEKLLSGQP